MQYFQKNLMVTFSDRITLIAKSDLPEKKFKVYHGFSYEQNKIGLSLQIRRNQPTGSGKEDV